MSLDESMIVTGATRQLAAPWLDEIAVLTGRLMSAIFTTDPAWTDYRPVSRDELRDGCQRYLTRVLRLLAGELPLVDNDEVAGQIGHQRAEQGVPLEAMLRTFRLGGRIVWQALLERAAAAHAEPDVVGAAATAMWTVVDNLSSALSTSYRSTQLEQLRRNEQHGHALIEGLLADRASDIAFGQRVADHLDLPITGTYLVVVADVDPDGSAVLRGQGSALSGLRLRSVWHVRTDTLVGLIPLDSHSPGIVLDRLRGVARGRVAGATAPRGLADVGAAHRLAVTALGTVPSGTVAVLSAEERLPECLLARSPELGRRLITARLGPILALPVHERDLLTETLTAWLEADRSASLAATRLYCHRNTVLNRLHRIATLVGGDLSGRQAFVEFSLALAALGIPGT